MRSQVIKYATHECSLLNLGFFGLDAMAHPGECVCTCAVMIVDCFLSYVMLNYCILLHFLFISMLAHASDTKLTIQHESC